MQSRETSDLRSISLFLAAIGMISGILLLQERPYALYLVGADIALRVIYAILLTYRKLAFPPSNLVIIFTVLFINLSVNLGWFFYFKTLGACPKHIAATCHDLTSGDGSNLNEDRLVIDILRLS
jgi:hypothetical protein